MARPRKSSEQLKVAGAKPGCIANKRAAEEAAELAAEVRQLIPTPSPGLGLGVFIAQVKREHITFFEHLVPRTFDSLMRPAINDLSETVQSFLKFCSSMTICARRMWESIRTGCRMTLPPSPVEDLETADTVSIPVSPAVKNTFWSAQSQDNLAQTVFRFAIF
jgi:hypothetical protein